MHVNKKAKRATFAIGVAFLVASVAAMAVNWQPFGDSQAASAAEAQKAKYVSIRNCKLCHSDKKTGDQYGVWKKNKHAEAYKTLGTPKAKAIAKEKGIADPQKDKKCLKCHVTGIETPELASSIKERDGVQCESCHGAGEFYAKLEVFQEGKAAAVAKGLKEPDEKVCTKCHNEESPTFPGKFDYKEMAKKIAHPNPEKKK